MPSRAYTSFLRYPFKNLGFMRFPEPVFAGIIGWLAGEQMGLTELSGAALIIAAVMLSAWKPDKRGAHSTED